MNLNYAIVFITEVLNDYFAGLQCSDLDIVPTDDTVALFKGQQILYKTVGNKLVLLVKVDDAGKPFIPLDKAGKMRFYVSVNNPDFCNYTNINFRPLTQGKYYFTNLNQTKLNNVLYLNSKVALYNNSTTYSIGDLAADAAGSIYEALRGSSNANKHALTVTAYWVKKGSAQYVNSNDIISLTRSSYTAATAPATNFTINVFGLNTATNLYDNPVRNATQQYKTAQTSILVDLSGLVYGKYRVNVNGTDSFVYLDDTAVNQNIAGIMEIFNHLPAANAFSLFDASGVPKQSTFTLRFANRSVIWRYITRTTDITTIKDTASVYTFTTVAASKIFVSNVPIPFKDNPLTTISIHSATLGNVTQIGNPGSNRLSNITQNGEIYYCSEKHLNY